MKESITKFDLMSAFKALDDLEMPVAAKNTLTEETSIRRNHDALVEEYYDVYDSKDMEEASADREAEINKAKLARIEKIVDLDANSAEDILPSYVGKVIMQCPQCMTMFYKDPEDIEYSEDDDTLVNVNEPCQHCGNTSGYTLVGKVDQVGEDEADKYDMSDFDDSELNMDFDATEEEPKEEAEEKPAEDSSEEKEESNEEDVNLEPIDIEEEPEEEKKEEAFKISTGDALVEDVVINEDVERGYYVMGYIFNNPEPCYLTKDGADLDKVMDGNDRYSENKEDAKVFESKAEADAWVEAYLADHEELEDSVFVKEAEIEESVNLNKEFHDINKKNASENDSENLSLNESKELDDKMKDFNAYIEYLNKMIEQEEEALEKASNELVKKAIQRRIDAFKADLDEALPEVIKEETVAEEAPIEEIPAEEAKEEAPVEEVKEEEKSEEQVEESVNLNKEFHDINKKNASENDSENLSLNESVEANKAAEVDAAEKNIDISDEKNGANQPSNNLADANVAPKEEIPNELQEAVEIKIAVEEVPGEDCVAVAGEPVPAVVAEPLPAAEVEIPAVVEEPACENGECADKEFEAIVANAKAKEAAEEAGMTDEAADEVADDNVIVNDQELDAIKDQVNPMDVIPEEDKIEADVEEEKKEDSMEEALNLTEADDKDVNISDAEIGELLSSDEFDTDVSNAEAEGAIAELGGDVDDVDLDKLEDIYEESLQECIANSLTNVYENVKSFTVSDVELNEGVMTISGNIEFASGKTKATSYVFNEAKVLNRNNVILTGSNKDLAEDCAVSLEGALLEGKTMLCPTKLNYKYSIGNNLIEGFGIANRK